MRWNTVILAALVVLTGSCTRKPERSLIGEWTGISGGQTASLTLNSDKTCRLVLGNVVLDGPTVGGKIEWQVDTSKNPMTLDFIATAPSGQRVMRMIFRFITDKQIQVRMGDNFEQTRPTSFSTEDTTDQIVLIKQ